jgi:hypothetical protein
MNFIYILIIIYYTLGLLNYLYILYNRPIVRNDSQIVSLLDTRLDNTIFSNRDFETL